MKFFHYKEACELLKKELSPEEFDSVIEDVIELGGLGGVLIDHRPGRTQASVFPAPWVEGVIVILP